MGTRDMSAGLTGGCLCVQSRYETGAPPLWVTICHCRFCQRATGSDRMIEPIFDREWFDFKGVAPAVHSVISEGSGKMVTIHFCATCGTKLALTFELWPDKIGVYLGTLDDPDAVAITPDTCKHIFVSEAQRGTVLPAGVKVFARHAADADGNAEVPTIYSEPFVV